LGPDDRGHQKQYRNDTKRRTTHGVLLVRKGL
jgi:hypothetical protein